MTSDKSIDPYKYKTKPGKDQITAETIVSDQFWASSEVMNIKKFKPMMEALYQKTWLPNNKKTPWTWILST